MHEPFGSFGTIQYQMTMLLFSENLPGIMATWMVWPRGPAGDFPVDPPVWVIWLDYPTPLGIFMVAPIGMLQVSYIPIHSMGLAYMPTLGWCQGGQCRHIWHTWSVWDIKLKVNMFPIIIVLDERLHLGATVLSTPG